MALKDDSKLLEIAKKRYKLARDKDADARRERNDVLRFSILLEQWPENVKNKRLNAPNGARPCMVLDKTNQYVRQVVNDMRQNRPGIKVRGINDESDEEVAEVLQGLTRHIEDQSRADLAYDWASELAVRCGVGYFRVITDYINQESFDQEICIKRIIDNDCVVIDSDSTEPDGSDQKWGFITEAISNEDFEASYPKADVIDFDSDVEQEWYGEKKIVIAEYFWLEPEEKELLALDDGSSMLREDYQKKYGSEDVKVGMSIPVPAVVKSRKVQVNQCKWAKLNGKQILERGEFPSHYIPIFPVIGNEGFIEGKRYLSGIVKAAMDSQRLYNYVRSAFTEAVTLAPKAPYIAAAGQIDDFPEWEDANVENYSVLRYNPMAIGGTVVGAPQRQQFASVPTGLQQDMEICEQDIQSAMGMYKASLGQESNEKSGKAILARQKEGDTSTFHYPDNLARTIRHLGRVLVGMIPSIYDTARVLRIIGEDGTEDFAEINPDQQQAVSEQHDETGAVKKIYNIGVGSYDVTVTVGPSYNTKRMEAADAMTQILQGNPDLMQIIGDLYFKSLDMPFSDEIAKRMKTLLPAPLHEQEGQEPLPPQVQQQMQQMEQALQNASQQMDEAQAHIQQLEFDQKAKVVEMNGKIQEAQIRERAEVTKAITEVEIAKVNAIDPARLDAVENGLMQLLQTLQAQSLPPTDYMSQPDQGGGMQPPNNSPPVQMDMPEPEQPPQNGGFFSPSGNEQ